MINPKRLWEEIKTTSKKEERKKQKITSRATNILWDQTVPKIFKALGPLENPHETPREPQARPKCGREAPKTLPIPSLDLKWKFFKKKKKSSRHHKIMVFD